MRNKRFELDLTNCELPDYWNDKIPRLILLRKGEYYSYFDVIDDSVNAEAKKMEHFIGTNKNIPSGFDPLNMPIGAVLRRLPDAYEL